MLEDVVYGYDAQGNIATETTPFACGSEIGPDRGLPTMSADDYAITSLPITALRQMYDQGLLPEQGPKE